MFRRLFELANRPHERTEFIIRAYDRSGKLISTKIRESRSFVRNWQMFRKSLLEAVRVPIVCVDGTTRNNYYPGESGVVDYWRVTAPSGNDLFGIVIGTGTTPPTNSDYKLESKVGHTVINHGACSVGTVSEIEGWLVLPVTRTFTNPGASAFTVNEVGLYHIVRFVETTHYAMTIRDVFQFTIPAGGSVTVELRFKTKA